MDMVVDQQKPIVTEEDYLMAMELVQVPVLPMVIRVAVELGVFDIIAKAGPHAQMSPNSIVSHLPTKNPNADNMLDRILRLLASFNVLTSSVVSNEDGVVERLYGLGPVSKCFIENEDGVSLFPGVILFQEKAFMDSWGHLKDAFLEGEIPFNKAQGMSVFEYAGIDSRFSQVFNTAMLNHATIVLKKVLETYKGFENLKEVVDVGGGVGTTISLITSMYPTIKGINFDLPHAIEHAPPYPGVEHVAGDMFQHIPNTETIFMKSILHDWSDELVVKLLKNCNKALPDQGKLILVEAVLPVAAETNSAARGNFLLDLTMMVQLPGGKERTEGEFVTLAKKAGFHSLRKVCPVYNFWVMELYKV